MSQSNGARTNVEAGLTTEEARRALAEFGPNEIDGPAKWSSWVAALVQAFGRTEIRLSLAAVVTSVQQQWEFCAFFVAIVIVSMVLSIRHERRAATALAALRRVVARVRRDGALREIDALEVVPGDIMIVRPGETVPADGIVVQGDEVLLDESALTGESMPRIRRTGDDVWAKSVCTSGELFAQVKTTGRKTMYGNTAMLLVNPEPPTPRVEIAVKGIAMLLSVVAVLVAALLVVVTVARREAFDGIVLLGVALVTAVSPTVLPTVLASLHAYTAGKLGEEGVVLARLGVLETLASVDVLCVDKTGTLTRNDLSIPPPNADNDYKDELLIWSCLACNLEVPYEKLDAIEQAIVRKYAEMELCKNATQAAALRQTVLYNPKLKSKNTEESAAALRSLNATLTESRSDLMKRYTRTIWIPMDPVSRFSEAGYIDTITGLAIRCLKGAAYVVAQKANLSAAAEQENAAKLKKNAEAGVRTIAIACCFGGNKYQFMGLLPLSDPVHTDAKEMVGWARDHGVMVKMVTGDQLAIAKQVARDLEMGTNILTARELEGMLQATPDVLEAIDGCAQVFPEHKYQLVKALQNRGHTVSMMGDGVNDAPTMKQADVGIAVSGATDAARNAASMVMTIPGLSGTVTAIRESRAMIDRVNSVTQFRIAETVHVLLFSLISVVALRHWPFTPTLLLLLGVCMDVTTMLMPYEGSDVAKAPLRWNNQHALVVAGALGIFGGIQNGCVLCVLKHRYDFSVEDLHMLLFLKLLVDMAMHAAQTSDGYGIPKQSARLWLILGFVSILRTSGWLPVPALSWAAVGFGWAYIFVCAVANGIVFRTVTGLLRGSGGRSSESLRDTPHSSPALPASTDGPFGMVSPAEAAAVTTTDSSVAQTRTSLQNKAQKSKPEKGRAADAADDEDEGDSYYSSDDEKPREEERAARTRETDNVARAQPDPSTVDPKSGPRVSEEWSGGDRDSLEAHLREKEAREKESVKLLLAQRHAVAEPRAEPTEELLVAQTPDEWRETKRKMAEKKRGELSLEAYETWLAAHRQPKKDN